MKKEINLFQALIPITALIVMLAYNVLVAYNGAEDNVLGGSNQFVLLLGATIAALVGLWVKVSFKEMMEQVFLNIKSTGGAILILLMVGALSGTWLVSGIIPAMIYYGLMILNPTIFLFACVVICAVISVATGSSWTTSATIGIALMGIGQALGIPMGMTAGAIISGGYFGDKMSPMSDTTNLAAAMAGTDLFSHIRYMTLTTVPTFIITLVIFLLLGFSFSSSDLPDTSAIALAISSKFNISLWLFVVPAFILILVLRKIDPLAALMTGTLLGGIFAVIFQPEIVKSITGSAVLDFKVAYRGVMDAITSPIAIETNNEQLSDLFTSKGMSGMLNTVWLIICAMVFGGVMEAIGALKRITRWLLELFDSVFALFASTVASCLMINITTSDQYLSVVVPGKMFAKTYEKKGLAPENLSRTLEDSGTVTSVLVPWNTCAAYNSGVLGVPTLTYLPYAFFNLISPFMTLLFAAFKIKIRKLAPAK
ncbi:Na+/H+ antiporter NhaC [Capnocytophaga canimorsus]|uniref:Sodium/hydrogen antiporter n=2 Tax=Capnocytophaga canimorsus TaxID=28188 RepID=F9YTV8_CAPCC|nr:Na+/H+ antiporter NhaC [Capnocytophaga canimorsus]AEK22892.1 Sodium/hydrogen antiporter [Capnocytophaga canimorsus Cc5]ATA77974.1 Na+/H+ antiporter NhaC [Capnocytophaga canimorsus]ATA92652.1 Na+/H+ antiporter NhaC [Capnocytophaga canimorsus]ATA94769.1 Na+/H+ antiporter NhaC [Capnocytophaga canimorsus]AWL77491.1 Na+/H+ antiporter NhaC [Capnocytophaga canimorsus]